MKIAIVVQGLGGGGAERIAALLADYLVQKKHDVVLIAVYSKEKNYPLNPEVQYEAIETTLPRGVLRHTIRSLQIYKAVTRFHADIVFSFITHELIPLVFSKIPVVPSLRIDPKSIDVKFLRRHLRNFIYHHADKVVFQTPEARDYFDAPIRKKGVVIENPITPNLPFWKPDKHRKVFMTACRLNYQKNLPMMMKAFIKFHHIHPQYILEIYGAPEPPEYLTGLKEFCRENHAQEYILFKGYTNAIHEIMSNSEVFLLSSDFEGISNAMLEALAIGVPCICTDCPPGGARANIVHGESGLLVPTGDVEAFFLAMCQVAESPDLQYKLSENAKNVRAKLDIHIIGEKWEMLL